MVVALLYEMQSPCNCFTLSLSGSDSRRSNSWREDNDATMEIKVSRRWRWWSWRCFGDGDHKHKMMMAISYHLYWLHVMLILYASYLALIDGSIIRWSLTKISRWSVLPEYAPLRKFFVLRHHVMIGCDRLYVQIQWVQNSCTRGILRLNLTSLAYVQIWPRNTETERSSVNHIVDMINIVMFTIETTPSHVMIGHGLVDLDHVIT